MKWLKFVGLALGIIGGVMASVSEMPEAVAAYNDAKNKNSDSEDGEA